MHALATLAMLLGACAAQAADIDLSKPIPVITARIAAPIGDSQIGRLVKLTTWRSALNVGDLIGQIQLGAFCSGPREIRYTKESEGAFDANLRRVFNERAGALGFSSPDEAASVFESGPRDNTDFRVGVTLLAMDYRICGRSEVNGSAYARMKWELFSTRRQQVVWSAIVESSYASKSDQPITDFSKKYWTAMVDNLLGDPGFVAAIRSGGETPAGVAAPTVPTLPINPGNAIAGGLANGAGALMKAVVTVQSGLGSGSGFFIGQEGYLLTNEHVVGDAKFVKVKLADGRNLVGEVLRADKVRDVALLRTDAPGTGSLALRRGEARIGEEVYALGSPFGETLSGTVTRGVLSAQRVFEGIAYLQSDVAINPGNSGGPLVDTKGQVLGIANLSLDAQGISFFIPIEEALNKLGISLQNGAAGSAMKAGG